MTTGTLLVKGCAALTAMAVTLILSTSMITNHHRVSFPYDEEEEEEEEETEDFWPIHESSN